MDIVKEPLRVFFVVGIAAIPILYWLFGRKSDRRDQDRARNDNERAEREPNK